MDGARSSQVPAQRYGTFCRIDEKAESCGVDGILLVAPYYNKPNQEGLYQHFKAIAEATSLPVMLYNVPGRTGISLSTATTLRLAEIPNIVATRNVLRLTRSRALPQGSGRVHRIFRRRFRGTACSGRWCLRDRKRGQPYRWCPYEGYDPSLCGRKR